LDSRFASLAVFRSLLTVSFLFPSSLPSPAAPRSPPSFPTRRSSDLSRTSSPHMHGNSPHVDARTCDDLADDRVPEQLSDDEQARSEEHTSELQSRFDLVCRLLLEKKKDTGSSPTAVADAGVRTRCST